MNFTADATNPNSAYHYNIQDSLVREEGSENAKNAAVTVVSDKFAEFAAAANEHNIDKHMSFYENTPNLNFIFNNKVIRGWHDLYENQKIWWNDGKTDIRYTYEAEFRALNPEIVLVFARIRSTRTGADNQTKIRDFNYKSVWQYLPEGWRIVDAYEGFAEQ